MTGIDSYDFGPKETWRGWQWNRIVDHLCDFRQLGSGSTRNILKNKTCLYLVGPNDRDREKALRKGFRNENLIAVDISEERVAEVRKSGGFAICGSLQQVLMNWPKDWKIDVIVADFCHGLSMDAMTLKDCLVASPAIGSHSIISVNMMRGRDADSNYIRAQLNSSESDLIRLHRGVQWVLSLSLMIGQPLVVNDSEVAFLQIEASEDIVQLWIDKHRDLISSYSSPTGHVFDSIVCRWPIDAREDVNFQQLSTSVSQHLSNKARPVRRAKQKVAALRAVRTVKTRQLA